MTITVGTDTFLSVSDADTYWTKRNDSVWSAKTTSEKEAALVIATQYLNVAYRYIGQQKTDQLLVWPRYDAYVHGGNFKDTVYSADEIPQPVKDACAELAYEALEGSLRPTQERGGAIKKEKVDVIEIEYMDWAPSRKTYALVGIILGPVLKSGGNMKGLIRS